MCSAGSVHTAILPCVPPCTRSACIPTSRRHHAFARHAATTVPSPTRGYGTTLLAECRRDYRLGMLNSLYVAVRAAARVDLSSPRRQELFGAIVSRRLAALEDHGLEEFLVS